MIDRRTLPMSALRAFEQAAQHLHLGRAGMNLGVTHGAISHQIRALEKNLDVKLFIRAHNRLELTSAGTLLYESVKEGLDQIIEGIYNIKSDDLSGQLNIGCTQTIATCWAAKHICEFQAKYPALTIIIKEIEPRQKLIPSDIDMAICYGAPKVVDASVTKLASPALFPVCSPALISGKKALRHAKGISAFTLLHDNQVSWAKWLKTYKVTDSEQINSVYFPNTSQALTAARLGYGVALGNEFETQDYIREGLLVRLSAKSIAEEKSYYFYSRQSRADSLKSRLFENWIFKACVSFRSPE